MKTDLKRLCDLLYGGNYQVSLYNFAIECSSTIPLVKVINISLPDAELDECVLVASGDAIRQVQSYIDYLGDADHGPLKEKIESEEFLALKMSLLEEVTELAMNSNEILSFRFKTGHPAYPVFWDFAFAFRKSESTQFVIGSSSD